MKISKKYTTRLSSIESQPKKVVVVAVVLVLVAFVLVVVVIIFVSQRNLTLKFAQNLCCHCCCFCHF